MDKQNIILIYPDQWRGDCLGSAGHQAIQTPFLDEMAGYGVRFSNAYSPAPTCIATRACLATGLSPNSTGRLGYRDFVDWNYPDTFMRLLRDSGYETICVGKTHFHPARIRLGFEKLSLYEMYWQDAEHPSDYHAWLDKETNGRIRDTAVDLDSNSWVPRPWTHDENLHPTTWTVTESINQLERRDPTRPFMLQVSFHRPHQPFDPPQSFLDQMADTPLPPVPVGDWADAYDHPVTWTSALEGRLSDAQLERTRRAYYAQMAHIDFQIGRLYRYLRGRKLVQNTWIIFSSDHGEMLGDHHLFRKAYPFEGSAGIPLIIKPPELPENAGSVCDCAVNTADLMPTLLELGGVPVPEHVEGRSLMPLVKNVKQNLGRDFIHGEHAPVWQYVTDGTYKFAWHSKDGTEWFFNRKDDPQECRNLANDPASKDLCDTWRRKLISVLAERPGDGLVKNGKLNAGTTLPAVRPELLGGKC